MVNVRELVPAFLRCALIALLPLGTVSVSPAAPQGQPTGWSGLRDIFEAPSGLSLRSPSAALHAGTVVVAANLFPIDTATQVPTRPIIIVSASGEHVDVPPGDFSFAFPKLLIGDDGVYHLLWAESSSRTTNPMLWPGRPLTSLWYSAYRNGAWSNPREILHSRSLWWRADAGTAVIDRRGQVHAVVLATPRSGFQPALVVLNGSQEWEDQTVPDMLPAYASIADMGRDSLLIAFTAPDRSVPSDGNSVFTTISSDAGATWSKPRLISRSGTTPASKPLALASRHGSTGVLWIQAKIGAPSVLRLVTSDDGGGRWMPNADAAIQGEILGITAFTDSCGTTAILSELRPSVRPVLAQTKWSGGNVSGSDLFPNEPGAFPTSVTNGSAHLIWVGVSGRGAGKLLHAQRLSVCAHLLPTRPRRR